MFTFIRNLSWTRTIHTERWLPWEDEFLKNYVQHNGKRWKEIVQHGLPHRTQKQCQARWTENINSTLGPFSLQEREILKEAVEKEGVGRWSVISTGYLPHRSPRRIANEWTAKLGQAKRERWTAEEDALVLKGVEEWGLKSWTRIAQTYLPHRTRSGIRLRYRSNLAKDVSKLPWSEDELDCLLRRTIRYGQDWNKVAEGLKGRPPEQCRIKWTTEIDPSLKRGPWSKEEVQLFWQHLLAYDGQLVSAAGEMHGRSRAACLQKFNETLRDFELVALFGKDLERLKSENTPVWRKRIASIVTHWLQHPPLLKLSSNKAIHVLNRGPWDTLEREKLQRLVGKHGLDWQKISKEISRSPSQCQLEYHRHLARPDMKVGGWAAEEDDALLKSIEMHGLDWQAVSEHVPRRTKIQCASRYRRVLRYTDRISDRLSVEQQSLVWDGHQMFGPNWQAIQMTYLPHHKPEQIMRWWNSHKPKSRDDFDRKRWTEEEDKTLEFAIKQHTQPNGISWSRVSNMVQNRSAKQCKTHWKVSLDPSLKKGRWDSEEELRLVELVQRERLSSKKTSIWPKVAEELGSGRSEHACYQKYYTMQRKGSRFVT